MWLSTVRGLSLSCAAMLRLLPPPQRTVSTRSSAGVIRGDMRVEWGSSGFPAADFRDLGLNAPLGRGVGLRRILRRG